LRAVLIDDEILAINLLVNLLIQIGGVEVVGKYTTASDGMKNIESLNPDIVFLDIEMRGENGIEAAEKIMQVNDEIDIIFVTAHDQYAVDAFNVQAVDYILKPIERERLARSMKQLLKRRRLYPSQTQKSNRFKAQCMGTFVLYTDQGQPIKWRTKKVKELCAYLLHHHIPIHRDHIIEELWPDLPLEKASTHLHTSVYKLRKELKQHGLESPILYMSEYYSLNIELTCDTDVLLQVLEQLGEGKERIPELLDLYKKDYLELEDYPWSIGKREKIRLDFQQSLEEWMFSQQCRWPKPACYTPVVEKLMEVDPFEERYVREYMEYLLQLGEEKKAVQVYYSFKEKLWKEIGEHPEKDTEEMVINYLK
jgi:two-component SAPR family response regulator